MFTTNFISNSLLLEDAIKVAYKLMSNKLVVENSGKFKINQTIIESLSVFPMATLVDHALRLYQTLT